MKYALVTGGSRGIGRSICLELATMGYHVLINYRLGKEEAEQTLKDMVDCGGEGSLLPFDVGDDDAVEKELTPWLSRHEEGIEVLVNNAGITKDSLLAFMSPEDFDAVLKTNLYSSFNVTRRVVKGMVSAKKGRIINIASESGLHGLSGQFNYSAAKGGMIAATKALALELGKKNVLVNAIAAGFIHTDMTKDIDEKALSQPIALKRFGKPEEVAGVVGFLASEKASYITGQVISVSGGLFT